jgi:hypothetical protein
METTALWVIAVALSVRALAAIAVAWEKIVLSGKQMAALQEQLQGVFEEAKGMGARRDAQIDQDIRHRKQYYEGVLGKKLEDASDAEIVSLVRGDEPKDEEPPPEVRSE